MKERADYRSGSRLRARVLDAGGGAVGFVGWRDTTTGVDCAFASADDGKMRCLPDEEQPAVLRYLDAACSQPVGVRSCGSAAKYLVVQPAGACDTVSSPTEVYELGTTLTPAPTYVMVGAACLPAGPGAQDTQLHELTKVLPATFAAATLAEEHRDPRLALQILKGEDGSMETAAIRDTQMNDICAVQQTGPDELRCAPALASLATGSFFADDGCQEPLLTDLTAQNGCPAPAFARDDSGPPTCAPGWHAVAVGDKVSADSVYQGTPSMCSLASFVPPGWAFYKKGAPLDVSTLARITAQEVGTGRLRTMRYVTDSHADLVTAHWFYDAQRQQPCVVQAFSDGKDRCVPYDVPGVDLYADDTCTTPVASISVDPSCPSAPPTLVVMGSVPSDPMCGGAQVIEHVYTVGSKYAAAKVWSRAGANGCAELDAASLGVDLYSTGAEVSASVFAQVTARTE